MATTPSDIKSSYPLPVYNYKVDIGSDTVAFSEVSGLTIQYETTTYVETLTGSTAGVRTLHMPGKPQPVNITLNKGIVEGDSINVFYNWIKTTTLNQIEKKDIVVRLCDETGATVIQWKVINAFPTQLDAPTFDASSNDVAIETMQLMADRIEIEERP